MASDFDPLARMGGTGPLPHPAAQTWYALGGRVGERAGADLFRLPQTDKK